MSVSFLLQCDSESDIDDKVRLLFLCLFTRHMKWLRVVNNKFELSTKRRKTVIVCCSQKKKKKKMRGGNKKKTLHRSHHCWSPASYRARKWQEIQQHKKKLFFTVTFLFRDVKRCGVYNMWIPEYVLSMPSSLDHSECYCFAGHTQYHLYLLVSLIYQGPTLFLLFIQFSFTFECFAMMVILRNWG